MARRVEKCTWTQVQEDTKNWEDDNDGYEYGLYLYEDSDDWQDIQDVEWWKTEEERDAEIEKQGYIVVFDN